MEDTMLKSKLNIWFMGTSQQYPKHRNWRSYLSISHFGTISVQRKVKAEQEIHILHITGNFLCLRRWIWRDSSILTKTLKNMLRLPHIPTWILHKELLRYATPAPFSAKSEIQIWNLILRCTDLWYSLDEEQKITC